MISSRQNIYKKVTLTIFGCAFLFNYLQLNSEKAESNIDLLTAIEAQESIDFVNEKELKNHQATQKKTLEQEKPKVSEKKQQEPLEEPLEDELLIEPLETQNENLKPEPQENISNMQNNQKIIKDIIISGNALVDKKAIMDSLPYKRGEVFDPRKTRTLIHNLYFGLKRFKNVKVKGEIVDDNYMNLHVIAEEKRVLKDIQFLPQKRKVSDIEIKKKINLADIPAIDAQELKRYEKQVRELYATKNFHHAKVTSDLKVDTDQRGIATFTIDEGKKSMVKRIKFKGNKNISSKELRKIMFTKESWILWFLDGSGSFQADKLEADKHIIEQYYQSNGYLKAKVIKIDTDVDEHSKDFTLTFHIDEGDIYTIKDVTVSGNDILKDEYLRARIPIKSGDLYSRKTILDSIKNLELIWGDLGYIFAHIEPSIQPDEDNKTINLAFYTELGDKVRLNKINIIGNKKTKDKVIRRKIVLREGNMITNRNQEISKFNVQSLGFFDPKDGVNWKVTRIDEENADLDLILKEAKTGHAGIKLGFGGSVESLANANSGFSVSGELNDTNLLGLGISLNTNVTVSKGEQSIFFNLTDPWLFDKPLTGAFEFYHRRPTYADFKNIKPVHEKLTGGGITLGFFSPRLHNSQVLFRLGGDRVRYQDHPQAVLFDKRCAETEYQEILNHLFVEGTYLWLENHLGQDKINHPMHPSRGYNWFVTSKFGLPTPKCNIGYFKFDCNFNWYTPLIGEHDLVFRFHTHLGYVKKFKNKCVPYRELYHIGGPATVRGFLFGQISPEICGDPIGGSKALFVNAELHFPITQDFNVKGLVFYDGGTGWDNPYANCSPGNIANNNFHYRHSVGIGFRMLNPVPVRVDWGFKLDRRKKLGETPNEVHFGMTYDW